MQWPVLLVSYEESDRAVDVVGLKPAYGGSTPPFLGSYVVLGQMQVPRRYDKEEGSHVVILHWLRLVLQTVLHVWQRMLLR